MIARSAVPEETPGWQAQLREAYRDPARLLADLGIDPASVTLSSPADTLFPFRVTRAFAARMTPGDPDDPLLRQVLPVRAETDAVPGFVDDPLRETSGPGDGALIQKYRGRALLVVTGACAINCRYCFRRAFPYGEAVGRRALERAVETVRADSSITEVILSGGDPLVLDDDALGELIASLAAIRHVRRLRVHTRLPVVLPARITAPLLNALSGAGKPLVVVVHVNHPRELDGEVIAALDACRRAGLTLLNQAVLLRGVNDDAETLAGLSEALFAAGVLPYYVNLLDRVSGSAHFEIGADAASAIQGELRARLPGYLVPRFVREIPGAPAKMPIA